MPDLLLEILSEEVPARMQAGAAADLKRLLGGGLSGAGLAFDSMETFVTPRRLTAVVRGLPEKTDDVREERKGPKADAPEKAIEGFNRSLPEGANVEERDTPKGVVLFATVDKPGVATASVLVDIVPDALRAMPWPKSMRWADHDQRWVRPIQSMVCLLDGAVVDVSFGPVSSGDTTRGHRFLAPQPFAVAGFEDYAAKLRAARVMLDVEERKIVISRDAGALAAAKGFVVKDDPGLLGEVAGLAEWPVVLMGSIDAAFMDLPPEVLTTSMRSHQKYFACLNDDGNLAPYFIVVAATETEDGGAAIVAGNERVLRARLADARFFWDSDRSERLESRLGALSDQVFHAMLGSVGDKADRLESLAGWLAEHIDGCVPAQAERAAELAKADLTTGMVGEFPELQGIMGRYYAIHDRENADVAEAIADHYRPQGPSDAVPDAPVSIAVALADKIDTLVGFWAIGEKPTGSKDPFALRRAALGVIRILLENELRLPLNTVFRAAARGYGDTVAGGDFDAADLLEFFAARLGVYLRDDGMAHDRINAVFSGMDDDLVRLVARARALDGFLKTDDGGNVLVAYRRAANILKAEEKKDSRKYADAVDSKALTDDAEVALNAALDAAEAPLAGALRTEDYASAMAHLAALRAPVDAFFDDVTVNADDAALRENRLNLLSRIRAAVDSVADFSKIES